MTIKMCCTLLDTFRILLVELSILPRSLFLVDRRPCDVFLLLALDFLSPPFRLLLRLRCE
jgi:hypothetical protein